MKLILIALFALTNAQAHAASACVSLISTDTTPVKAQYSCDGADLQALFDVSGVTAGISKATVYFLNKGYTLNGCTESYVPPGTVSGGYSTARCVFVKP